MWFSEALEDMIPAEERRSCRAESWLEDRLSLLLLDPMQLALTRSMRLSFSEKQKTLLRADC